MTALGKYAIIEIAKKKDEEREHSRKIANSSSRIRKVLWKTHQRHLQNKKK